ncbi:hypothetical protein Bca4012_001327 [Brassica carinata]
MLLSKRWWFLWTSVPRLEYDDSYQSIEYGRFSRFVVRFLFLHEAPVIETLHFKLGKACGAEDIRVWIRAADKCCMCELIFGINASSSESPPIVLPSSLYTGCRMLHPGNEFVSSLLSSCHVLEELHVEPCLSDNLTVFTARVSSLKSLVLHASKEMYGFVIDAPSFEWLDIVDYRDELCHCIIDDMPKILTACFDVTYTHSEDILRFLTSVKRLDLCLLTSEVLVLYLHAINVYPSGIVFYCLVHLKICTCLTEWLNLLMCMLRDSPKLKSLKLQKCHVTEACNPRPSWNEPNSVPKCLVSSLEALEWVGYEGT